MRKESKCNLIVIDNFYDEPLKVRDFALSQKYITEDYYPGKRSEISFSNENIKNKIEEIILPFAGKIIKFVCNDHTNSNGKFQYTTSHDRSWIHADIHTDWGAIVYLTPNAPLSSGTGFYKLIDSNIDENTETNYNNLCRMYRNDMTKWKLVDNVGNVFNRLIIFNSKRFHSSMDYFGTNINDGRLFQVFFFNTEYK
jgi:hypothetical protein